VIDGRNLYRPEQMARAGFAYHSIGRSTAVPETMPANGESHSIYREPVIRFAEIAG
jgi:hypothetical protein